MQVPCERCGGKGKISKGNCGQCYGKMTIPDTKILKVIIERGMKNK
jgi:DnaJ-class molecular chaperone